MRLYKVIIIFLFIFLLPQNLFAWNIHGEMTRIVLDSLPWINRYKGITITNMLMKTVQYITRTIRFLTLKEVLGIKQQQRRFSLYMRMNLIGGWMKNYL